MIIININNYEEWVIDFLEGTLSQEATDAMNRFLAQYPAIAAEIEELQGGDFTLSPDKNETLPVFPNKNSLKKVVPLQEQNSITRANYERFVMDHLGGNLTPALQTAMLSFLGANPDLAVGIQQLDKIRLQVDTSLQYHQKTDLYRNTNLTIDKNNYEAYVLDHLDGTLSPANQSAMQLFFNQNPAITKQWKGLDKIKLQADESIVFANKNSLKKRKKGIVVLMYRRAATWSTAVAAALALFFWLSNATQEQMGTSSKKNAIAQTEGNQTGTAPPTTSAQSVDAGPIIVNNTATELETNSSSPRTSVLPARKPTKEIDSTPNNPTFAAITQPVNPYKGTNTSSEISSIGVSPSVRVSNDRIDFTTSTAKIAPMATLDSQQNLEQLSIPSPDLKTVWNNSLHSETIQREIMALVAPLTAKSLTTVSQLPNDYTQVGWTTVSSQELVLQKHLNQLALLQNINTYPSLLPLNNQLDEGLLAGLSQALVPEVLHQEERWKGRKLTVTIPIETARYDRFQKLISEIQKIKKDNPS
ncbi:MAG: hypothetical protein ACPGXL_01840 [Chitinophagales bacterium]